MNFYRIFRCLLFILFSLHLTIAHADPHSVHQKLAALETKSDGRLGISAVNTANNQRIQYRSDERFPTGSTFKVIGVSAVLKKSIHDKQLLQQTALIKKQDLTSWSPVTEKQVDHAMSIFDLCAAAISFSDNTAIFLLMDTLGGPQQVVNFARTLQDHSFKMNSTRDHLNPTSTPSAMEKSLQTLTLGNVLPDVKRKQLITWMKDNSTGNARIRAGVPKGWVVADKTGSGEYGLTNDIAIIWPPNRDPIVVVIYFEQKKKDATARPAVVAEATRILLQEFDKFLS